MQENTKHTPGPWQHVAVEGGWDGVAPEAGGVEICNLVENNPSNARLIAAASELLEVCREMLGEIRAYNGESEFEEGSPVKAWCDMLKAAIAKATGGAS